MPTETVLLEPRLTAPNGTWAEIRLDRIIRNLERLREKIDPSTRVVAVVKANAYGHGLVPVAKALSGKADFLGIASLKEASILREQGIATPLLVFGCLFPDEIPVALQMRLILTVSSFEEAQEISQIANRFSQTASVHIKVDTGMGRLGIPYPRAQSEIERIAGLAALELNGIYTHFANAEDLKDPFGEKQLNDFERLIQELEYKGIRFPYRHAANSAGTLRFRSDRMNLVRPGISLYGVLPDPVFNSQIRLEPALSLKSRIAFLKRLAPGDSVSYGREFVAKASTTVGVIPVGYSHGYPFQLSSKGHVLYRGKRYAVAGRVCMDWTVVDLGVNTPARVGDEVTLLGTDGTETIKAEELARSAQTIPYEILTRLDAGLPRFYRS